MREDDDDIQCTWFLRYLNEMMHAELKIIIAYQ